MVFKTLGVFLAGLWTATASSNSTADAWAPVRASLDNFPLIRGATLSVARNDDGTELFAMTKGASTDMETMQMVWSSTKLVVGTAIMAEVEKGNVDLDLPIYNYLWYWTSWRFDRRSRITLRHLLGFSSGYADVTQTRGFVTPTNCLVFDLQTCVRDLFFLPLSLHTAEPGSRINYNSIHLQVAGAVVEKATGKRMIDIIRENVLSKAGMTRTRFFSVGESQGPVFGRDSNPFLAGGIEAPPREYMQFLGALTRGELVSRAYLDMMFSDPFPDASRGDIFGIASTRYGLTNWYECPQFISSPPTFDDECRDAHIHTSPGASGTYPIIDLKNGYHMYLGYDGVIGLGAAISAVFRDTLKPLVDSAVAGVASDLPTTIDPNRLACLEGLMSEYEEDTGSIDLQLPTFC